MMFRQLEAVPPPLVQRIRAAGAGHPEGDHR
jgi:hypothetical protein